MGKSLPSVPYNFDSYSPFITIGGRIIQMCRGQDTMWASLAPNNDKASNKPAWQNGDAYNIERIRETLKDGASRTMTEIGRVAGMSRVCTTRMLHLMLREGIVRVTKEHGRDQYSLI